MQSTNLVERASLYFLLPDDLGVIEIPSDILAYLETHQQKSFFSKEAGGQLFWQWTEDGYQKITSITGPRPTDKRGRNFYQPDHRQESIEIDEHYERGHYFLGDWHTHPERIAKPSPDDIKRIKELYKGAENRGEGFLLIIVGTIEIEKSITVLFCNIEAATLEPYDPTYN